MHPAHCPNPSCIHFTTPTTEKWYVSFGYHHTNTFGKVSRYRCKACHKTFSDQTFSIDYYAKRRIDYPTIMQQLISASGNRDIARNMRVKSCVIQNRIERLSRWCIGIHHMMIKRLPLSESFAADGFESFSYSQYYPNNINILAGRDSQFLYYSGLSVLRRKGRMTSFQRARRTAMEKSGRADPRATRRSMATIGAELAKLLYDKGICQKDLWTDEHGSYPGAFRQRNRPELFRHHRISSKRARTGRNPLFAVNYLDRQFRKDLSDHARETVQFAHNPACMMSRFVLYRQYHNYLKPFRIKEHNENRAEPCKTHAEAAGLDMAYYRRMVKKYRGKRFFLNKLDLDSEEENTWRLNWKNPGMHSKKHIPLYLAA